MHKHGVFAGVHVGCGEIQYGKGRGRFALCQNRKTGCLKQDCENEIDRDYKDSSSMGNTIPAKCWEPVRSRQHVRIPLFETVAWAGRLLEDQEILWWRKG